MEELSAFMEQWRDGSDYIEHILRLYRPPEANMATKGRYAGLGARNDSFSGWGRRRQLLWRCRPTYIAGKMMAVPRGRVWCTARSTACSNNIVLDDFEGVIDLLAVVPSQMQAFADKPRYSAKVRNLLVGVPRLRRRCVGAFAMRI